MLHRENKIRSTHNASAATLLKEILDYHDITQADFAERIGVSQKHVSEILNRKVFMSEVVALRIEQVMGVSSKLLLSMNTRYRLHQEKKRLPTIRTTQSFSCTVMIGYLHKICKKARSPKNLDIPAFEGPHFIV